MCFLAFSINFVLISYIFVCTRSDALDSRGIGPSKSALTVGDEDIMLTIEVPFAQRLRWQLSTKSHFTRIDFVILTISKFISTYTLNFLQKDDDTELKPGQHIEEDENTRNCCCCMFIYFRAKTLCQTFKSFQY